MFKVHLFVLFLSLILTASAVVPYDCGALTSANTVYTMNQSVSSAGTCFTINATNVTLDCAGNTIDFATGVTGTVYGIFNGRGYNYTNVTNCRVVALNASAPKSIGYASGVTGSAGSGYGTGNYSYFNSLSNNYFNTTWAGLLLVKVQNSTFSNTTIIQYSKSILSQCRGLRVEISSEHNTFNNTDINSFAPQPALCTYLSGNNAFFHTIVLGGKVTTSAPIVDIINEGDWSAAGNYFNDLNVSTGTTRAAGIRLLYTSNNLIDGAVVNMSGSSPANFVRVDKYASGDNNTLMNFDVSQHYGATSQPMLMMEEEDSGDGGTITLVDWKGLNTSSPCTFNYDDGETFCYDGVYIAWTISEPIASYVNVLYSVRGNVTDYAGQPIGNAFVNVSGNNSYAQDIGTTADNGLTPYALVNYSHLAYYDTEVLYYAPFNFTARTGSLGQNTTFNQAMNFTKTIPINLTQSIYCGINLDRSWNMTEDLNCPADGIILAADNLALDCKGHYVNSTNGNATIATGKSNAFIKNCTLKTAASTKSGVFCVSCPGITLQNLAISHFFGYGIYLDTANGARMESVWTNDTSDTTWRGRAFYLLSTNNSWILNSNINAKVAANPVGTLITYNNICVNNTIENTTLFSAIPRAVLYYSNFSGFNRIINSSTISKTRVLCENCGLPTNNVTFYWYAQGNVSFANGSKIEGAIVNATSSLNETTTLGSTNAQGFTNWLLLPEVQFMGDDNETNYSPYAFTATYAGLMNTTQTSLNQTRTISFFLSELVPALAAEIDEFTPWDLLLAISLILQFGGVFVKINRLSSGKPNRTRGTLELITCTLAWGLVFILSIFMLGNNSAALISLSTFLFLITGILWVIEIIHGGTVGLLQKKPARQ